MQSLIYYICCANITCFEKSISSSSSSSSSSSKHSSWQYCQKKVAKRYFLNSVKLSVFILIMHILFYRKNQKNVLEKEIKDWTFKGATQSYRKIIFVSATKIGRNTINILNCYFRAISHLGPSS